MGRGMTSGAGGLDRAKRILAGENALQLEIIEFARELIRVNEFGLARRLLAKARAAPEVDSQPNLRRGIELLRASATYRDPDLAQSQSLEDALSILNDIESLSVTTDPELLGLAGTIEKRRGQLYARRDSLERALSYYLRGYESGADHDDGYFATNSAFVLELLAFKEGQEGALSDSAQLHISRAKSIRYRGRCFVGAIKPAS
jgi:hypothetical protein